MSEAASSGVTLTNCDSEPIHVPGAIQPHGVLFACEGGATGLTIRRVSANLSALFDVEPESALDRPLTELFDGESAQRLAEFSQHPKLREVNPFRLVAKNGRPFDATAHRSGSSFVVELERSGQTHLESLSGFDPRLRASLLRLQDARDVGQLTATAAEEVRALTGFDRVMIYRFDADWNGEIVAESKREDLETFLGLHYPASDIPAQARRLYTVNWLRFIVDVDYRPVPLLPPAGPLTAEPFDMSHSVLRSVSPIHLEYLRNMGVRASMSISLVIDGVLSGLIACHHYEGPRLVPPRVRDTAEYLGYSMSWQLSVLEASNRIEQTNLARHGEAELVRSIATAGELLDGLSTPALAELTCAGGAAVAFDEGLRRVGRTPGSEAIRKIVDFLNRAGRDTYATDQLSKDLPEAAAWEDVASGLLAVAVAPQLGEYLLWFRPAVVREVHWGGDPDGKQLVAENGQPPRLSPRGSFELWKQVVKGRSQPWASWHVEAASSLRRVLLGGVRKRSNQLRQMNQRLLEADRAKDDFLAVVSHELRTPLTAISGWTTLLRRGGLDSQKTEHALDVIERNAQTQMQLIEDLLDVSRIASGKLVLDARIIDLTELLDRALESLSLACESKRLELRRDFAENVARVRGDAVRLRQVVTNLINNAVKFTPRGGRITVGLRQVDSSFEISVSDTGQGIDRDFLPYVFEAFRQQDASSARRHQGLGLGLAIVKKLVEAHGGQVSVESAGTGQGSTFRALLPVTPFTLGTGQVDELAVERPSTAGALSDTEILVVEDDSDSRELITAILEGAGARVCAVEDATVALATLASRDFDAIVSDIGMPDMDGHQLMQAFRARDSQQARKTPAVALSAYTRATDRTLALRSGFQAHVPKPIDSLELVAAVVSVLSRRSPE